VPPNKGMKLTKPGELRSFAAYPQCSADAASSHHADDGSQRTNADYGCRLRMMPATDDADDGSRRRMSIKDADDGCRLRMLTTDAGH